MTPISLRWSSNGGTTWSPEKFLADWGYADGEMALRSRAASTFTIRKAGDDPSNPADVPYKALVEIYRDRTISSGTGSGGTKIFAGRRTDFSGDAQPGAPNTFMVFSDPWWDLQNIIFQHYWKSGSPPVNVYSSRLNLFQDISAGPATPWVTLTVDKQLQEICNYAQNQCGANLQFGAADPAWAFPFYGVKAITCAEALLICLKSIPDCVTYFDYTATPPKLYFKQAANLTAVTLPYAGTDAHGRAHQSSRIRPRPDLQLPQVVIQYQTVTTISGVEYVTYTVDAYPALSTGQAIGAQVIPIDLRGGTRNDVNGTVVSQAVDPTTVGFWQQFKPDLARPDISSLAIVDTTINGGSGYPDGITVTDASGSPVSLATYPNAIIGGQVAPWMASSGTAIVAKEVTISATLKYLKSFNLDTTGGTANLPEQKPEKHRVSVRLKLTNSAAGTQNYSALAMLDPGDPAITGLAQNIYTSFQTLQFEGEHTIVDDNLYQILGPGNALNLSGGNAAWATMAAVIAESTILFHAKRSGIQTVRFGVHQHLGAKEFFEFIKMWSWRRIYDNPNVRNTGVDGSQAGVTLGQDTQKENTQHGLESQSVHTTASPPSSSSSTVLQHDANTNGGQLLIATYKVASGAAVIDTTQPQVQASQNDLNTAVPPVAGIAAVAKWRTATLPDGSMVALLTTKNFAIGAGNMNWRGHWASGTAYAANDVVYTTATDDANYNGKYLCVTAHTASSGNMPTFPDNISTGGSGSDWILLSFNPQNVDYYDAECAEVHRVVNTSAEQSGA